MRGGDGSAEIAPRVLSRELKALAAAGLIDRRDYGTVPPKVDYRLTPMGRASCRSSIRSANGAPGISPALEINEGEDCRCRPLTMSLSSAWAPWAPPPPISWPGAAPRCWGSIATRRRMNSARPMATRASPASPAARGRNIRPSPLRSHQIWRELEAELGVELFTQNGLLVIFGPGQAGRQSQRGGFSRRHRRRREEGEARLRDSRHGNDQGALSRLQCRRRRRGLPRHGRRLRASRAMRQRPIAEGEGAGRRSAPERDGRLLRSGGRLGHA